MMRWLRRLFVLGALAGGGYGTYQVWLRRQSSTTEAPEWPALTPEPSVAPVAAVAESALLAAPWVAPVDGTCPEGYPVKANSNSRIFHVPGGRFYDRTVAERCYATADDAVIDGYRPAKA